MRHYCGEEEGYTQGLFIDESIASIRTRGGHHPVHSGGHRGALRGKYLYEHGVFRCGQCNIIVALSDISEGDGATMVVPGSHKSNFAHPLQGDYARRPYGRPTRRHPSLSEQGRRADVRRWPDARWIEPLQRGREAHYHLPLRPDLGSFALRLPV